MSYNDYQEYQEYLERERIAKIRAEENRKLAEEEHATVMGIILFGFIAIVSTFAFFIKHPKVVVWLLVAALSITAIPHIYKGAIALFNSVKIEGEWINAKNNPTYLPDSLIDKETCMARIEKAIKDGKLEVREDSFTHFWTVDNHFTDEEPYSWLKYTPAYDLLCIADNYMTRLRSDSLSASTSPFKIVLVENFNYLVEEGIISENEAIVSNNSDTLTAYLLGEVIKSSGMELDEEKVRVSVTGPLVDNERGYYIDKENSIVYTWFVGNEETLNDYKTYELAKYIDGSYDEKFLRHWVSVVCDYSEYDDDKAWLTICKDSLKRYMEQREKNESMITDFYAKGKRYTNETLELIESYDDLPVAEQTVDKLQEIVGDNSVENFIYEYLVNAPYCADQYPEEVVFYDDDISNWGDEYRHSPYLKILIAEYNAYDRLFPGESGDDGVHPGNSEEEYQHILETRKPLIDELNARIEDAFAENHTLRWYDLIDRANLEELITHYDMTVMQNEKYYAARETVNYRYSSLSKDSIKTNAIIIISEMFITFTTCIILKNLKKKKRKERRI